MRRALAIAVALVLALPASALAHATLEATTPARGAVAPTEPSQVVLRFDEPVEGNFGAVRVFDARGDRVDDGKVVHPGGRGSLLAVGLRPELPQGTFTATYRVISADSHPVSGGFVFSVGKTGAAPSETVGDLLSGSSAGRTTEVAFGIARGADYLAIALLLGTLLFGVLVWRRGAADAPAEAEAAFERRTRPLLIAGLALGIVATASGIALQGATAGGTSFWSALDPGVVRDVLGTRFGTVWGLRLVDLLLLGVVLAAFGPRRPAVWALPAAFLAVTPALGGHATTQHPVALLAPLDVAHVLAMSAWIGGLVALLVAVPAATRSLDPPRRAALLSGVASRFSTIALIAVVLLLATGVVQAIVHLRSFDDLLHTAFGRAVLIKIGLVVALIGLGAVNRRQSIPRLRALAREGVAPGAAGRLLRRT
ncbi:MAG: copper resistance protein CopC, partial [Conexibacter sp.]|nr:copper resistance protein CopC [Conexibacter sp.]